LILVVGVEVWRMVRGLGLCVHTNNDTEKAGQLWH
jgi:hypothetical protein